jgi:hypothetical protein
LNFNLNHSINKLIKYIDMKNIIISMVAILIFTSSCKDFLTIEPQNGKVTDAQFFKTKEDFEKYIFGTYAVYNGHLNNEGIVMSLFMGGEIMQDIVYTDQKPKDVVEYMSPSNLEFLRLWRTNYKVVTKANLILDKLPDSPIDDKDKILFEAEARFLRGFAYYHLASAFSNVPLITEPYHTSQNHMSCSPESEIWNQVIEDLSYAAEYLPGRNEWDEANVGRATKGAAYAFLAVAYMNTKNWTKAEKATTDLIALGEYELLPDVRQVFNPDRPNTRESLFEIQFRFVSDADIDWGQGPLPGTTINIDTAPQGIGSKWAPGGGWGGFTANRKLANSFDPRDERRTKLMVIPGEKYKGLRMTDTLTVPLKSKWDKSAWTTKYWVGPNPAGSGATYFSDNNIIAMRYAEVLLNYAEILFQNGKTNQAYDQLNLVRARVKLDPLTVSPDYKTFITDLMNERRWELNFEPNLWYHYMRTETAADYFKNEQDIIMNPAWITFPIPQAEIDQNPNLCQNEGY